MASVNYKGRSLQVRDSLPKKASKGDAFAVKINGKAGRRIIVFEHTGKEGFGRWKIRQNSPA